MVLEYKYVFLLVPIIHVEVQCVTLILKVYSSVPWMFEMTYVWAQRGTTCIMLY